MEDNASILAYSLSVGTLQPIWVRSTWQCARACMATVLHFRILRALLVTGRPACKQMAEYRPFHLVKERQSLQYMLLWTAQYWLCSAAPPSYSLFISEAAKCLYR